MDEYIDKLSTVPKDAKNRKAYHTINAGTLPSGSVTHRSYSSNKIHNAFPPGVEDNKVLANTDNVPTP